MTNQKKFDDARATESKIQKLGISCFQNGLTEADIERAIRIKRYGKEKIVEYALDHAMSLKDCEKVYQMYKVF